MIKHWRLWYRLVRVGVHVLAGCLEVIVLFRFYSFNQRMRGIQRWSQQLLSLCAVRYRVHTEPGYGHHSASGCLLVVNHVSWLDVFVLLARQPAVFVCKADVVGWPLVGWLAAQAGTLFLQRESRQAAHAMNARLVHLLQQGQCVAVFPEGTSTDGRDILPFRPALLQAAVDAQCPVQPLAVRYTDTWGGFNPMLNYAGTMTLWQSVQILLRQPGCTAWLDVLTPIPAAAYGRRQLALICYQRIRTCLLQCDCAQTPAVCSVAATHDAAGR